MHTDAVKPGDRVLLIDDLIATGGTMMAGKKLLERLGAQVIEGAAIVDLPELGGSDRLRAAGLALFTLVRLRRPLSARGRGRRPCPAAERPALWPNSPFAFHLPTLCRSLPWPTRSEPKPTAAPPRPCPPRRAPTCTTGRGQKVSLERGSHTRSKKNPGKRAGKGG